MCALRVVLTVDRSPLFRHHSGGEPQPEPEEVACNRMQGERVMRLVAMQEYRYRNDSDVVNSKAAATMPHQGRSSTPENQLISMVSRSALQ